MTTYEEKAIQYFKNSFNCAQAVLTTFSKDLGLSENESLKISCAFGAGMGRQQMTCGAVTGAMMVLGLKFGKGLGDNDSKKKETYEKTVSFFNEFTEKHGSTLCKYLMNNLDMNNDEDYQKMVRDKLFETKCKKYIEDAVSITEKLIGGLRFEV